MTEPGDAFTHVQEFLDKLYVCTDSEGHRCGAILAFLNVMLLDKHFDAVDRLLQQIDVDRLSAAEVLCVQTMTGHGRKHLPSWQAFTLRTEHRLIALVGPERAENLLANRR